MSTHHEFDAASLLASDEQLKVRAQELAHFRKLASEEQLQRTVAALKENHKAEVVVVNTRAEALEAVLKAIPKGASISAAGSHTLTQIGYDEWAKKNAEQRAAGDLENTHRDYKAESLAKYGTPESGELRRQGLAADVFLSSVVAISEEGELYAVDLTGTRTGGFLASKHLLVVAGTQKIVKDHKAVLDRTHFYAYALESARVRIAYKIPASSINNVVQLNKANPFGGPRLTVVLVKEELGF